LFRTELRYYVLMPEGETIIRIRRARARLDRARADLFAEIRTAIEEEHKPSEIARAAEFSREYIAKIRDGRTKS
jgi:hypothetical protein